jgi:ABC-type transporter Mla subunit MlaD
MATVGEAFVNIRANADPLRRAIADAVTAGVSAAEIQSRIGGQQAGDAFGDAFSDAVDANVSTSLDGVSDSSDRLGDSAKNASGNLGSTAEVLSELVTSGNGSGSALASLSELISNVAQTAGGASQAFSSVSQGLGQATQSLSGAMDGFADGSKGLSKFAQEGKAARKQLDMMILTGNIVGQVVVQLGGAIGALVSGLFSLGSAVAFAAQSLIVLPALLGAVLQGALTLILAFRGVGEALGAGFEQSTKSGSRAARSGSDNARAIELALRRLRDAYQSAQESAVKNLRNVAAAEQDLSDAVNDSLDLQRQLTRARLDAAEAAQQLAFSVEGAALAEERAGIALENAQRQLIAVQSLPPDNRARREVELTFKEAELNYREAKDRNADLTEEQRKSAEAGIEGSQEVLAVKNDIVDADQKVIESQEALMRALEEQAIATREAQEGIADALSDLAYARKQGGAAASAAAGAVNKFQEALKNLSPAQREFVKFIVSLQPMFKELRNAVGEGFFPPVTKALKDLFKEKGASSFFNLLKDAFVTTARYLGIFVGGLIDLFKNPFFRQTFFDLMESNATILGTVGFILQDLGAIIVYVLKAAAPLTQEFARWVQSLTDSYRATLETTGGIAELSDTFFRAGNVAKIVFGYFSALWDVLKGLGEAALPSGIYLFKQFTATLTDLEASIKGNKKGFEDFFNSSALNFEQIMKLAGGLVKILFKLGASPAFNEALQKYQEAIPLLEKIGTKIMDAAPAFAALVVQVLKFVDALTDTGAINAFFDALRTGIAIITPIVGFFAKLFGVIFSILVAFRLLGYAVVFFAKAILGPLIGVFSKIGSSFGQITKLMGNFRIGWGEVFKAIGKAIAGFVGGISAGVAAAAAGFVLLGAILIGAGVSVKKYSDVLRDSKKAREDFQKKFSLEGLDNLRDKTDKTRQAIQDLDKAYSLEKVTSVGDGWNRFTRVLGDVVKNGVTGGNTLRDLNNELKINETVLKATDGPIKELADKYGLAESSVRLLSVGVVDSTGSYKDNYTALETMITSTVVSAANAGKYSEAQKVLASNTSTATDKLSAYKTVLDGLNAGAVSVTQTTIAWKRSVKDLEESFKTNGGTLDLNTVKGQANAEAIIAASTALRDKAQAEFEATGNMDAANKIYSDGRTRILKNSEAVGLNKTEVDKLVGALKLIPKDPLVVPVDVQISSADRNFVNELLKSTGGRIPMVLRPDLLRAAIAAGGKPGNSNVGGPVVKGRPYIVGENRPELFVPTQSGIIIPKIPGLSANMAGRSTILDQLRSPYKLAAGGLISPSSSGTLALLAEAGRAERVTPLDSNGFTPAERQILAALQGDSSEKDINIQVFVGNQQIQDIVDVKMNGKSVRDARRTNYSRPVN